MRKLFMLVFVSMLTALSGRAELIIAEGGACDYQIVIPDAGAEEIVDRWLRYTAGLIQTAFRTNGFEVAVVREADRSLEKPGIYLGATDFAREQGVELDGILDWTYYLKVAGKDIVIAGRDLKDPLKKLRGKNTPMALLGSVKGACDFLRDYMGVRFLFISNAPEPNAISDDGTIRLDTRSVAFMPTKRVSLPAGLNVKKTPMLKACAGGNVETFYHIANNFFPMLSFVRDSIMHWGRVIPRSEYGESHPEYFALLPDGSRSIDKMVSVTDAGEEKHCVTQQGVIDLMVEALSKKVQSGERTIMIMPPDSYRLCYCNCDSCTEMFDGLKAASWSDVSARGRSGKLWQAYFAIARGLAGKHPEARLNLWDYQDTPVGRVQDYPENVVVQLQLYGSFEKRVEGINIPAGISGLEESFTGFGAGGRYMPERTPEYAADLVKTMHDVNVQWTMRDGDIGQVPGLQAPAYYVYGRMLDDPEGDWKAHLEEFCTAAFRNAGHTMQQFFNGLHEQIAIYSDYLGVGMQGWNRKYGRSKHRDNKWYVVSMYTPEYLREADALLSSAQRQAREPDIQARLELLRIDFEYIKGLSRIYNLHDSWIFNPTEAFLNPLLDSLDDWHDFVRSASNKPLDTWPEMRPFCGHGFVHAAMITSSYQQRWNTTCINWDTEAIRSGILDRDKRLTVPLVPTRPAINSELWEQVQEEIMHDRNDMPFRRVRTSFKALRDSEAVYVQVKCLYPAERPSSIPNAKSEKDVFKQEYLEVAVSPGKDDTVFRFASNPNDGMCYDARWTRDAGNRSQENLEWNGDWEFDFHTTEEKGLMGVTWTGWFRIPFATIETEVPDSGSNWGFNVCRVRKNPGIAPHHIIWRNANSITESDKLGELCF